MLFFGMWVLVTGCGASDDLQAENDRLLSSVAELETRKGRLEREADALHAQVNKLNATVSALERLNHFHGMGIEEGDALGVDLVTSMGTVNCTLWPEKAPKTVLNFVQLAEGTKDWTDPATEEVVRRSLYEGTVFHRIIPGFMIQGGDPLGSGRGGPGFVFEDETKPSDDFDRPGLMAMANRGPNTNGSQFFVTHNSKPRHLNGKHTIFGHCEDATVFDRMAGVQRDARDRPLSDVVLRKVVIRRG